MRAQAAKESKEYYSRRINMQYEDLINGKSHVCEIYTSLAKYFLVNSSLLHFISLVFSIAKADIG